MEDIKISAMLQFISGNGKIVEAVDENHGVVYGNFYNKGLVMIGTPKKK